jgi:hypothetical protein
VEAKNGAKKRRAAPRGGAASPAPEPQQDGAAGGCAVKSEAPELRGKGAAGCVDGAVGSSFVREEGSARTTCAQRSLREEGGGAPKVGRPPPPFPSY